MKGVWKPLEQAERQRITHLAHPGSEGACIVWHHMESKVKLGQLRPPWHLCQLRTHLQPNGETCNNSMLKAICVGHS